MFGGAGLAFVVVELTRSWHQVERLGRSWPGLVIAFVLAVPALACAARSWSALLGQPGSRPLHHGFYLSQLGKYVPGGVWQAAGQVGFARDEGIGLGQASAAFPVFALTQVVGAAAIAAVAALGSHGIRPTFRWSIVAGVLLVAVLHRGWMRRLVDLIARALPRVSSGLLPEQRAIVDSFTWNVAGLVLAAVGFTVLLQPPDIAWWFGGVVAFMTGWWIGFLALPFPSGIGVREAIMVGLLAPHFSASTVVVASIGQRVILMLAETTMIAVATLRRRRLARRSG